MDCLARNAVLSARVEKTLPCVVWLLLLFLVGGCGPSSEDRRFMRRLNSGTVADRLKAMAETPRPADAAIRTELLRIFENGQESPLIRSSAGITLGGLHDARIVPAAMKQLPDSILTLGKLERNRRMEPYLLGKALAAYGPEALPEVAALLRDPRREVVTWAIMHHGSYRHSDRAYEVLARYLNDRDIFYRRAAAFGLSMVAHPQAEALVALHLGDVDAEVRYNLAWALLNYGSSLSLRSVEAQLVVEKEPGVRQELTKALAIIKSRPVLPPPPALRKP